jgi:Holliday junction DNA helicase RuvA
MIAKLTGLLDDFGADWAVIDVGGVGYLVQASARTLASLGNRGDRVVVHTEMQVSDSDMRLIGFASAGERAWFRLLTVVQGVGSKVALAILSALTVDELQRACAMGDAAMVARANGVGPKLASRIVNELKDKAGALAGHGGGAGITAEVGTTPLPAGSVEADAVSALQNLGFRPATAASAVAAAMADLGDGAPLGDVVRVALKRATA